MRDFLGMSLQQHLMAGAAIVAVATGSPAMAQTRLFNVPAQPASRGIPAFARQAGVQIIASGNVVGSRRTNAVRGSYSVPDGLRILLQGTGLTADVGGAGGIITVRATPGSGEARAGGAAADSGSAYAGATAEILVVGSRSQNTDIRRTEDDPQPYVVFDAEALNASGARDLEEFLRTRLPMNTQAGTANQPTEDTAANPNMGSNINAITLRGLGANQTLILVDGRRAPRAQNPVASEIDDGFTPTQGDINGIPLSAIERIEILPSTAGGIYGGGAVGGVINIIRKRDYSGLDLQTGYNGTFRGGGEVFYTELSGGFSPDHGVTQISFSASHSESHELVVGDNDLWRRARNRYFSIPFNLDPANVLVPEGYTANITSSLAFNAGCGCFTRPNLVLKPGLGGTNLGSYFTSVPIGFRGVDFSNPGSAAPLAANAGQFSLGLGHDVWGREAALRGAPTISSANVNITRSLSDAIDLFADLSFAENDSERRYRAGGFASTSLLASSPANPFQQSVTVAFPIPGLEGVASSNSRSIGATLGFVAKLGDDWSATAEYDWNQARTKTRFTTFPISSAAIRNAYRNGSLQILRDVNEFPLDYAPYLPAEAPTGSTGPSITEQRVISARLGGVCSLRLAARSVSQHY